MTSPTPDATRTADLVLCHEMLSRLCGFVWSGRTDKHLWSIPADEARDFDCLFMAAFDELERTRAALLESRRQALAEVQQQIAQLPAPRGTVVKGTVLDILEQAMKGCDHAR